MYLCSSPRRCCPSLQKTAIVGHGHRSISLTRRWCYPPNHVEQAHPRARRLPLGCPRQRVFQPRSPGNRKLSHDNSSPTTVQDAIASSSVLEAFLQRSYLRRRNCGTFLLITGCFFPTFFLQLDSVEHGVNQALAFYTVRYM